MASETYTIDAKNKKLGRVASEVALILQGKKSAFYNPRLAGSGNVVLKNVSQMDIDLKKMNQKRYYRHTGYMGHLKEATLKEVFDKSPAKLFKMVVEKMLPNNYLKPKRMKRLTIEN